MMDNRRKDELAKLATGITGFDQIANGGLPKGRTTLISGTAGSGKTILALQFLLAGVRDFGESGVFVTFEEAPADLMQNVRSFGWDLEGLVAAKKIAVVDATPEPGEEIVTTGPYDLSALLARIENAIRSVGAKRVILDALGARLPGVPVTIVETLPMSDPPPGDPAPIRIAHPADHRPADAPGHRQLTYPAGSAMHFPAAGRCRGWRAAPAPGPCALPTA